MATLIFKNKRLQGILRITEQSTVFRATFSDAIKSYEKDTGQKYNHNTKLERYYETDRPTLWLVKDDGIYLMTSAKMKEIPEDRSHVCYAEGFEPTTPNCWEKCRAAVGGDDFVESIELTNDLKKGIKHGADIHIDINRNFFTIKLVYK